MATFTPPTITEVEEYFLGHGVDAIDARKWAEEYVTDKRESGWRNYDGHSMKSWKTSAYSRIAGVFTDKQSYPVPLKKVLNREPSRSTPAPDRRRTYYKHQRTKSDWRSITDDKEKYAAYLCSREWNVLREAVHKRAGGKCERCKVLPIAAVHHLTYERKYREDMEDLQAICTPCHEFTHGKSDLDPNSYTWRRLIRFLLECKSGGLKPPPFEFTASLTDLNDELMEGIKAASILAAADLEGWARVILQSFPFSMPSLRLFDNISFNPLFVEACYVVCGFDGTESIEYLVEPDKEGDE